MNGMLDPFDRAPFTVGKRPLVDWYSKLAELRNENDALSIGAAGFSAPDADVLTVLRFVGGGRDEFGLEAENGAFFAVINRSAYEKRIVADLWAGHAGLTAAEAEALRAYGITRARCLLSGDSAAVSEGLVQLALPPESARIYRLM